MPAASTRSVGFIEETSVWNVVRLHPQTDRNRSRIWQAAAACHRGATTDYNPQVRWNGSASGGRVRSRFMGLHRAMLLLIAVVASSLAGRADASGSQPPQSVAEAVALATDLASASGIDGQDRLAAQADIVAAVPPEWVVPCLDALRDATPAGANWLRSGLERAVDRAGDALPADQLAAVVRDQASPPRARGLAYVWLKARQPHAAETMLDAMLDDPSLELRREAIDKLLASAAVGDEAALKGVYRQALAAARDIDQIERIAAWLGEHGEPVDLAATLGFVRRWLVSPVFDNRQGAGFAKVYPPESPTPDTSDWKPVVSADKHGAIDLNAAIATEKGVVAYALATIDMPQAGPAEVRIGSPCAVQVWVNGEPVMQHEIYHASEAIDQYVATADFRAGPNTVLVKCCQNEQTEAWAADWKFQLRICDRLGTPLATQRDAK